MTRLTVCALVCLLAFAGQGIAAEIGGYIYVKGNLDSETLLWVKCASYPHRYDRQGSCYYGRTNVNRDSAVAMKTKLAMVWQQGKPCVYRCPSLSPGLHVLSVRIGNTIVTKTISIPKADFSGCVNMSLDTTKVGSLEVVLPNTAKHCLMVSPKCYAGQESSPGEAIGVSAISAAGDTKIAMDGLRGGKYLVTLYWTDTSTQWQGLYGKDQIVKTWVLDVKAGRVTSVRAK